MEMDAQIGIDDVPVTIFRVPGSIRTGNEADYEPMLLTIGPYHWGNRTHLSIQIKEQYLEDLLNRDRENNNKQRYMEAIQSRLKDARQCYHDIDASDDVFSNMLLLDSCFLIELFLKRAGRQLILPQIHDIEKLRHDLVLMENQIPFFILKVIYDQTQCKIPEERYTLSDLAISYLCNNKEMIGIYKENSESLPHHLLELLQLCHFEFGAISPQFSDTFTAKCLQLATWVWQHIHGFSSYFLVGVFYVVIKIVEALMFVKKPAMSMEGSNRYSLKRQKPIRFMETTIPNAKELNDAGMPFHVVDSFPIFIDYCGGSIYAGQLDVHDNFFTEMENMLVFEYCKKISNNTEVKENGYGDLLAHYMYFMRKLVRTAADVVVLRRCGILKTIFYNDDDLVNFFRKHRSWLIIPIEKQNSICAQFKEINKYCRRGHSKRRAKLMQEYFTSSLVAISFISVVIIMLLAIIQTVFTIIQTVK